MCLPQRAKIMLQAMIRRFQSTKQIYRRFKRTPTGPPDAESSSELQRRKSSSSRRRSSFYRFIAPQVRKFHGNELLLLSKRITLESEARALSKNGIVNETYPIKDITAHCVTQLTDEELMMVQKAIMEEFELRGRTAHEEVLAEDEACRGYVLVDVALESMGRVDLANIDKCHGCFGQAKGICAHES